MTTEGRAPCYGIRIVFRVDASTEIGTGHVMRCLTLADILCQLGANCIFICRPHKGHLIDEIEACGHDVISLPAQTVAQNDREEDAPPHAGWLGTSTVQDAQETKAFLGNLRPDWLVVDHYALGARWESEMHSYCARILVIDDLADRAHRCDMLLDYGLEHDAASYASLTNAGTHLLCGPKYALLRPTFAKMRDKSLARRMGSKVRNILVSFGGVDKANATSQVLEALSNSEVARALDLTVVLGTQAPFLSEVRACCAAMPRPPQLLVGATQMAKLMFDADFSIGAAGTTSWERCCLGLPSIAWVQATNQTGVADSLERAGAAFAVYEKDGIARKIDRALAALKTEGTLSNMSANAAKITDGRGAARVAAELVMITGE